MQSIALDRQKLAITATKHGGKKYNCLNALREIYRTTLRMKIC